MYLHTWTQSTLNLPLWSVGKLMALRHSGYVRFLKPGNVFVTCLCTASIFCSSLMLHRHTVMLYSSFTIKSCFDCSGSLFDDRQTSTIYLKIKKMCIIFFKLQKETQLWNWILLCYLLWHNRMCWRVNMNSLSYIAKIDNIWKFQANFTCYSWQGSVY